MQDNKDLEDWEDMGTDTMTPRERILATAVAVLIVVLAVAVALVFWQIKKESAKEELPIAGNIEDFGEEDLVEDIMEGGSPEESAEEVAEESEEPDAAYFGYEDSTDAQDDVAPENAEADEEELMSFEEVDESVTAKDATNLRDIPSQGENSTVQYTLKNGEVAKRTGISDSGWSRVEYGGQTYYAVSNYLTTDLTVKVPEESVAPPQDDDGIKTVFAECNEQVSPKIEVNLRTLPSVTNPDAQVVVTLKYGEVVTRTGINTDYGWSRVVYNGQTLYCVSSYIYVVESAE